MKFYLSPVVKQARYLRKKGLSYNDIAFKLGISPATVLRWCHDIASRNKNHLNNRARLLNEKKKSSRLTSTIAYDDDLYKIFASLLYWCEGAKYPSSNFVAFANSDSGLIQTFIRFFRKGFNPVEGKFRVHLQVHSNQNYDEIKSHWSKLLKIDQSQFYKPTITHPKETMKRRNYVGTCTIRYHDVSILMEIIGIYESFIRRGGRVA
jgi:hypothetical protein